MAFVRKALENFDWIKYVAYDKNELQSKIPLGNLHSGSKKDFGEFCFHKICSP